MLFLGASPVRLVVENWDMDVMIQLVKTAGDICARENLPFSFVTEDTTRSNPSTLDKLFRAAIDCGASRFIICDTTGHSTPDGLFNLLTFTRNLLATCGAEHVQLDWHGHNDRGLALTLAHWNLGSTGYMERVWLLVNGLEIHKSICYC